MLLAAALSGAAVGAGGGGIAQASTSQDPDPPWSMTSLGVSAQGQPLIAYQRSKAIATRHIAVFGVIHGDELAGRAVTDALLSVPLPANLALTIVPTMNPDGERLSQRGNANQVDLNRNFPFGWLPAGASEYTVGGYYPGTGPLSEPEAQGVHEWIARLRPNFAIWYHQPWGTVVCNDGSGWECPSFAAAVGMPAEYAPRPGSAADWASATGTPAAVVELPEVGLTAEGVAAHVAAILNLYAGA